MVDRSLLKENNIKVHFYYGREISVEGKQYKAGVSKFFIIGGTS